MNSLFHFAYVISFFLTVFPTYSMWQQAARTTAHIVALSARGAQPTMSKRGVKILYNPQRKQLVTDLIEQHKKGIHRHTINASCAMCRPFTKECTRENKCFLLKKFEHSAVILNLFPYNTGHLLIVSRSHTPSLEDLNPNERSEIMEVINLCVKILKAELAPDSFNIGINIGRGSLPEHLHVHILPRWKEDTNFLVVLDNTKPLYVDFHSLCDRLKKHFDAEENLFSEKNSDPLETVTLK